MKLINLKQNQNWALNFYSKTPGLSTEVYLFLLEKQCKLFSKTNVSMPVVKISY